MTTTLRILLTITFCGSVSTSSLATAADAAATPTATKPAAAEAKPAPTFRRAKIDWKNMSKVEKRKYMKSAVMKPMKAMFQKFDSKHYKDFSCATCHGDAAEKDINDKDAFKMPNPQLPKLPMDPAGFQALKEKKPQALEFMGTKVKPAMAALLNLDEWTPQNQSGFGCYQCHVGETASDRPGEKAATKPAAKPGDQPAGATPAKPHP